MKTLLFVCTFCFSTCTLAFDGIFAFLKYDRDYWMEQASMELWQAYAKDVVTKAHDYGFTGLVVPPTAPISDKHDAHQLKHMHWMRDKQLYLLDLLHAASMQAILVSGNPASLQWDRAGSKFPFHRVYNHPAVIALKAGDEPKNETQFARLVKSYHLLRAAYPDKPVITVFIGEAIGGTAGSLPGKLQTDMLPHYIDWWNKLETGICTVRNYWLRSRNNRKSGQFGDYDLHNPYVPEKLAVHPEKMMQLVRDNCPGEDWAFVGQGFGKCAERGRECYWRFPTETEILEQADLAFRYGAKWFMVFALTPSKEGHYALLDDELRPMRAEDNSYPIHAFKVIREKYLGKSCQERKNCNSSP